MFTCSAVNVLKSMLNPVNTYWATAWLAIYGDLSLSSTVLVIRNEEFTLCALLQILQSDAWWSFHITKCQIKNRSFKILLYFSHTYIGTFVSSVNSMIFLHWSHRLRYGGKQHLPPRCWHQSQDLHMIYNKDGFSLPLGASILLNELLQLKVRVKDFLFCKEYLMWWKKFWCFLLWNGVVAMFIIFNIFHCVSFLAPCTDEIHLSS
jgi:hypothetical protein